MRKNAISTSALKRLLISHNFMYAARYFFEVFMSIYIWKETQDLVLVAWFNIAYLMSHTIFFSLFSGYVKKGRVHFPRKVGLIGFAISYLVIYLLGDKAITYAIPIAFAVGLFNGLYWISYQILRFDLTSQKNRGNYTGLESGTKIGVEIIMPVLGGFIITMDYFGLGYANLFLLGSLLYLISFFIGNVSFPIHKTSRIHIRKTWNLMIKNSDIRKAMWSFFVGTFSRGGSLPRLLIPLLIFDVLRNEFHLGGWLSFFSVIAIIFTIGFGRYADYKHYKNYLTLGGVIYFILILSLIFFPSFYVYILLGILLKIVFNLVAIPKRVISENLINTIEDYPNHRIEYIVIREWFNIAFGRVGSYVILLFVAGIAVEQLKYALIVIGLAVLVEVYLLRSIKLDLTKV